MTTPQLALHRRTAAAPVVGADRHPLASRLAYPFLVVGLVALLTGYGAVALLLLRAVVGLV